MTLTVPSYALSGDARHSTTWSAREIPARPKNFSKNILRRLSISLPLVRCIHRAGYNAWPNAQSQGVSTMRVMVIVKATEQSEAGVMPSEELFTEMGNFN